MDNLIADIETAGFQWAICKQPDGTYSAYVTEYPDNYIGDTLCCGLGCEDGPTAEGALRAAFDKELGFQKIRSITHAVD